MLPSIFLSRSIKQVSILISALSRIVVARLCWLLSISVPKKSANDGSTDSFSLQFLHQLGGVKISCMTVYIPDFGTDMLSSQHSDRK